MRPTLHLESGIHLYFEHNRNLVIIFSHTHTLIIFSRIAQYLSLRRTKMVLVKWCISLPSENKKAVKKRKRSRKKRKTKTSRLNDADTKKTNTSRLQNLYSFVRDQHYCLHTVVAIVAFFVMLCSWLPLSLILGQLTAWVRPNPNPNP